MQTEFQAFVKEQEKTTGIKIVIYLENGKLLAGEGDLDILPVGLNGVYSDKSSSRTYFSVKCKGKKYIGRIEGAGETERVYATLLKSLAENSFAKEKELTKYEFLKQLLFADLPYTQYKRFAEQFAIKALPCFCMSIILPKNKVNEVYEVLSTYSNAKTDCIIKLNDGEFVFIKFIDENSDDYRSATEYAECLSRSVYEETGANLSIAIGGTVKTPFELSSSFSQAVSARRMGEMLGITEGVHSFKEYVLTKILEDLPKYKLNEYLSILALDSAEEIFNDKEMVETAEVFLENNLNVSETARILFLHRNTLTYRLDKIEKHTGLNVRKFADAVTFRLITMLMKLTK